MGGNSTPTVETHFLTLGSGKVPFNFRLGGELPSVKIAYETYGKLNAAADNAILLFHAMTGSQHAAGYNPSVRGVGDLWNEECHVGWWDNFIGPGKAIDTNKYFVICANYIGGCYGSTGPASRNPRTQKPYGADFPAVTSADIATSQAQLIDHLGIGRLHAVIGASIGGMFALSFACMHPERVRLVVPMACGTSVTTLQRIHIFEQIFAIESDTNFKGGNYYEGQSPNEGLALARMICHKTFVSIKDLSFRAKKEIVSEGDDFAFYKLKNEIESYMLHQGAKFVRRFDANSYLRILDTWQRFDLAADAGVKTQKDAFEKCANQEYLIFTISSDVAFYPEEQDMLEQLVTSANIPSIRMTAHSDKGHDSFFLEPHLYTPQIAYFLERGAS